MCDGSANESYRKLSAGEAAREESEDSIFHVHHANDDGDTGLQIPLTRNSSESSRDEPGSERSRAQPGSVRPNVSARKNDCNRNDERCSLSDASGIESNRTPFSPSVG